jgi:type I restriction enzyme M protein
MCWKRLLERITRHPAAGLLRQIVICFPFVAAGFKNYIYKGAGMVTGTIKNKVDKIWTDIWAGGITNPLTVIEQLTYLMFIRSLDEKELEAEDFENTMGGTMDKIFPQTVTGQSMRWSKFKDRDPREIYEILSLRVFPAIKKMKNGHLPDFNDRGELIEVTDENGSEETAFARYMDDAMFLIPTPQVLQKIITGLDDLYENDISDLDMQGDLYEYMLGKLSTAGQNGQFRTPKHIREMMVELVQPTPDDLICESKTQNLIQINDCPLRGVA